MADKEVESTKDSKDLVDDKTSYENEDILAGIPDEDEEEKEEEEKKPDRSEIAQKIKWREKYNKAKEELDSLKEKPNPTEEDKEVIDDKEKKAKEYLSNFFKQEYKKVQAEEKEAEARALRDFEDKVDATLEDNPDITENDLLDVIEEYEVEPEVAVKILKKYKETEGKPKPKLPAPKRGSPSAPKPKTDDSDKSMHDVAQEVIKEMREKNL